MSNKEATDISSAAGSKGLEAAGGVAGALEKERQYRGATEGEGEMKGQDAHAQDHDVTGEQGSGTGAAN
ncbi:hypothetical protein [Phaffia rhodozyma]|uniref:Uncharacterized protein n=1 Tax=Phaffia rhodozyma TaxID=264483 RepID=A0A0F7SNG2_PHARH|nr:hypothetical protein [Phaffia rhodozyma]